MARVRTQKAVAGRIDLNYHRRWHRWRVTRLALVLACTVAAAAWVAVASVRFDRATPGGRGGGGSGGGGLRLLDAIHNPGALTGAHASIEHDCRACHDGAAADGSGPSKYWLNVSDNACLKCHDGALHHQNQKTAAAHADVSFEGHALAVKDATHAGGGRSASCVSCHVEHRGHDLLVGTSNQLCVHCHADIGKGMESGQPRPQMRAVKFTVNEHPRFGSRLAPASAGATPAPAGSAAGQWTDPTNLKFGHALHARPIRNAFLAAAGKPSLAPDAPAEYLATDCLSCHENAASPVAPNDLSKINPGKWANTPPPYVAPGTSAAAQALAGDPRYMAPIAFDRHCVGCHDGSLRAPPLASDAFEDMGIDGFAIPHQDVPVVRTYVESAVRASFARFETDRAGKLDAALAAAKKAAEDAKAAATSGGGATATTGAAAPAEQPAESAAPRRRGRGGGGGGGGSAEPSPPPAAEEPSGGGGGRGRGRGRGGDSAAPATIARTPEGWIKAHAVAAASAANSALGDIDTYKDRTLADPSADGAAPPDLAVLVDYYTSYVTAKQCFACHGMTGDPPALDDAKNAESWTAGKAFATAATGIPEQPRRWFAASTFDHFAHRGVDCRDCHAPAWTSGPKEGGAYKTATAHVLTSDIDGAYPGAAGLATAASARSCVSCHHADTRSARGATDSCVSCHWYHDAKLQRPMTGPLGTTATPTTRPAAAAAQQQARR